MNWATISFAAVLYGAFIYFAIDQCVGMMIGSAIGIFARVTGDKSPERLKVLIAKSWIKPADFIGTMFAAAYGGYSAAL
ncbi:MAG: hypothetical protein PHS14_15645, partial [Elusimicrobia bacterium]|nr:hypothetical protein [Elusimicrobiota bacterium]